MRNPEIYEGFVLCLSQWDSVSGSLKASVSPFINMKMNTRAIVTHQQERKEQLFRSCLCLLPSLSAAPVTAMLCTSKTAGCRRFCARLISKASVPFYQYQPGWGFAKSVFWHISLLTQSTTTLTVFQLTFSFSVLVLCLPAS